MESSVYRDGIYGAGFFSDATNNSTRWGNGKFRSPIEITNDEDFYNSVVRKMRVELFLLQTIIANNLPN